MEVLKYPHQVCNRIVIFYGFVIGPIGTTGETQYELIPVASNENWMHEGKGYHDENFVNHLKTESEFSYSPLHHSSLPAPTKYSPMKISVYCRFTGAMRYLGADNGVAQHLAYSVSNTYGKYGPNTRHIAMERNPAGFYNIYYLNCGAFSDAVASCWVDEITSITPISEYYLKVNFVRRTGSGGYRTGQDLYKPLDALTVKNLCVGIPSSGGQALSSQLAIQVISTEDWLMPWQLRELVTKYNVLLDWGEASLPEQDFGILADAAAKQVSAQNRNMLEFLKDLRHPTKLIPKLRNMEALKQFARGSKADKAKALADDYLCVKYGIMPTIADLKSIVKAFKKNVNLDKKGRIIVNARHKAEAPHEYGKYTLEQHAKLCVAKDDSGLRAFARALDNIGVFPSFSNLWDLIPYSFVIDWFVGIGGLLDRLDGIRRLTTLEIFYATLSRKRTTQGSFPATRELPISASVNWSHYHRWVQVRAPLPPLSLQSSDSPQAHWLEATALVVQRKPTS